MDKIRKKKNEREEWGDREVIFHFIYYETQNQGNYMSPYVK